MEIIPQKPVKVKHPRGWGISAQAVFKVFWGQIFLSFFDDFSNVNFCCHNKKSVKAKK
jgi:hypothetical protein